MDIPKFKTDKELFVFLKENEDDILYAKKSAIKFSDGLAVDIVSVNKDIISFTAKAEQNDSEIKVRAIINTTNVIDSHDDMHVKGLWDKSLDENKNIKYLQEHKMAFDKIIADKDDLEVSAETMTWKSLGYDFEGETQALIFDANIKEERNPFMFKQFKNRNVDNNSVGMRYIQIKMAFNTEDEEYAKEKENWDKYYPLAVNKDDKRKMFFPVIEAKAIEGSAVPMGSNAFTPVFSTPTSKEPTQQEIKSNAIKSWLGIEPS